MSSTETEKGRYLAYLNDYRMDSVTRHRRRTISLVYGRGLFNTYWDYMETLRQTSYEDNYVPAR